MNEEKVQKMIDKALKAQRKAIIEAIKADVGDLIEQAGGEKEPTKTLKAALKAAVDAAKTAEVAEA